MRYPDFFRSAALFAAVAALSGCFRSEQPLIAPGKGDFPFETLTYIEAAGSNEVTLVRDGDSYRAAKEGEKDRLVLKSLGADRYLAQIEAPEGSGPGYLYGVVVVAADRKGFVVSAGYADDEDVAAIREGVEGLAPCTDDAGTVCVEDLDAYRHYAEQADVLKRGTSYRIVRMK